MMSMETLVSFVAVKSVYVCVCVGLQGDESFLQELFSGLADDDDDDNDGESDGKEKKCDDNDDGDAKLRRLQDMAQFLKEFCLFSQTLAPQNRDGFFKVHCLFTSD